VNWHILIYKLSAKVFSVAVKGYMLTVAVKGYMLTVAVKGYMLTVSALPQGAAYWKI